MSGPVRVTLLVSGGSNRYLAQAHSGAFPSQLTLTGTTPDEALRQLVAPLTAALGPTPNGVMIDAQLITSAGEMNVGASDKTALEAIRSIKSLFRLRAAV